MPYPRHAYILPLLTGGLLLCVWAGCGRSVFGHTNLELCADCTTGAGGDSVGVLPTWAEYVETLPAEPACASGAYPPLVVNTTDFSVDGPHDATGIPTLSDPSEAGATLSLAEAGWIVANRVGPEVIVFDPEVFPPERATVISVRAAELPFQFDDVCLDGRGTGVVVDFSAIPEDCLMPCGLNVNQGRVVGLDLRGNHEPHQLSNSSVALTRMRAEGRPLWLFGAVSVGPNNVILGTSSIIVDRMATVDVHSNWWGYDPAVAQTLENGGLSSWNNRTVIRDNVIGGTNGWSLAMRADDSENRMQLRDNWFGIDRNYQPLAGTYSLISLLPLDVAQIDVGPDNHLETHAVISVVCSGSASVHVSGNPGLHSGQYVVEGAGTAPLPSLDTRTVDGAGGTCWGNGVVELMRVLDSGDTLSLGTTTCVTGGSWNVVADLQSGQQLVATLTTTPGCTSPPGMPWSVP